MYYNNKRLALSIFWILLGGVLLVLSLFEILDSSMYAGMGGALVGVGALQTIRIMRYRNNSEYRERIDTEISDERNQYLHMKSWAWTGYIVVMAEAAGSVVAMVTGHQTYQIILSYSVCLIIAVYWIVHLVLSRKY